MKFYLKILIMTLAIVSGNIFAAKWPHTEIRAVGKNLVSMAGFYVECSQRRLVEGSRNAIRFASFMGVKYLIIGGILSEAPKWAKHGQRGILIFDPATSEKTITVKFTKETCANIKRVIDAQYEVLDDVLLKRD